jgi:hypothetical protein
MGQAAVNPTSPLRQFFRLIGRGLITMLATGAVVLLYLIVLTRGAIL